MTPAAIFVFAVLGIGCGGDKGEESTEPATCSAENLDETYTRYVEPFVSGSVQSSCTECHMTGIDISMYAQDTPCQTLACMVDSGVVDLANPEGSSLLAQIQMGDTESSVFDVEQETAAMLEWITWSADCHEAVCGEIDSPCSSGTGAESTGVNPIGDCTETDLLASFWDAVIIDRGRCNVCHSDWAEEASTYGACTTYEDCEFQQDCLDGLCRNPGPYYAPHIFEGLEESLNWYDADDQALGLYTMYNTVALGLIDEGEPLDSSLLTKPLLEYFQPTAIYGPGVEIPSVEDGVGRGISHGGTSKFNFGCHDEPCPTSGVVDCRVEETCGGDVPCSDGLECSDGYCRIEGSLCDATYTNYIRFIEYFVSCK